MHCWRYQTCWCAMAFRSRRGAGREDGASLTAQNLRSESSALSSSSVTPSTILHSPPQHSPRERHKTAGYGSFSRMKSRFCSSLSTASPVQPRFREVHCRRVVRAEELVTALEKESWRIMVTVAGLEERYVWSNAGRVGNDAAWEMGMGKNLEVWYRLIHALQEGTAQHLHRTTIFC